VRDAADTLARVTRLETVAGRPSVIRNHRTMLRSMPTLDAAVAAVAARLDGDRDAPADEPLFVFSAGWRSGSTFLQRLVLSAGTHFVWGEPYHHSDLVRRLAESLVPFGNDWPPANYLYEAAGDELSATWIANLYPPVSTVVAAHRAALATYLAPPPGQPAGIGWGMKEVRLSGEYAGYLRLLFPGAKFIFLVRNPADAYASYRERPRWFERWPHAQVRTPRAYGRMWSRLAVSFLDHEAALGATFVRYEDLVADHDAIDRIERLLGAPVDRAVLSDRIGSTRRGDHAGLTALEARMLGRETDAVGTRLGYLPAASGAGA
jgi:hypothetical protein